MDEAVYRRLAASPNWEIDNLHDAYLVVGGNNPNLLARSARQRAIDEYRRRRRQASQLGEHVGTLLAHQSNDLSSGEAPESIDAVRRAVAELPQHLKTVTELHWFDGLTPDEVASTVGCKRDTVYTRLRRAKAILKADKRLREVGQNTKSWGL